MAPSLGFDALMFLKFYAHGVAVGHLRPCNVRQIRVSVAKDFTRVFKWTNGECDVLIWPLNVTHVNIGEDPRSSLSSRYPSSISSNLGFLCEESKVRTLIRQLRNIHTHTGNWLAILLVAIPINGSKYHAITQS